MDRRSVIKNVVLVSVGAGLFPSCIQDKSKSSVILKNIPIDSDKEKMLAELTATILPLNDAKYPGIPPAHLFVLMMIDECSAAEERKEFVSGMDHFEEMVRKRFGKSFLQCTKTEREHLLKDVENEKQIQDDVQGFYSMTKRLTIQNFRSSKYFLTEIQKYEMVPGRFHGCFPVTGNS